MSSAPPIANYEKLLTIDEIIVEGEEIRECQTAADVDRKVAELQQSIALVLELKSATTHCKDDFVNAQTAQALKLQAQKVAREKAKSEQKPEGGKAGDGTSTGQRAAI